MFEVIYGSGIEGEGFYGSREFKTLEEATAEFLNPKDEFYGNSEFVILSGPNDLWKERWTGKDPLDNDREWNREIVRQAMMMGERN